MVSGKIEHYNYEKTLINVVNRVEGEKSKPRAYCGWFEKEQ